MKVLVLGAGPAGVRAAIRARELGADVTLIERDRVGGVAVNSGPAPVRTLARVARHCARPVSGPFRSLFPSSVSHHSSPARCRTVSAQAVRP